MSPSDRGRSFHPFPVTVPQGGLKAKRAAGKLGQTAKAHRLPDGSGGVPDPYPDENPHLARLSADHAPDPEHGFPQYWQVHGVREAHISFRFLVTEVHARCHRDTFPLQQVRRKTGTVI